MIEDKDSNAIPKRPTIDEWRANRTAPEVSAPQEAPTTATTKSTVGSRIDVRRNATADSAEGEGGDGDDGQSQTVAKTPLFISLGIRVGNAGQDIHTPKAKEDPMDRPAEDMGSLISAPSIPKKRKRGF